MEQEQDHGQEKEKLHTVKEFFEEIPPGKAVLIENLARQAGTYIGDNDFILPELNLFCDNESCEGFRLFEPLRHHKLTAESWEDLFVEYKCKNCDKKIKTYALLGNLSKNRKTGTLYKYGELPEFGPPTPAKVVSLIGAERDYYFKGRRVENQGLGIAAFAYYRRVVENQKNKIFDEIIRTVKKVDANNTALLGELENAKKENQFTKAVDSIKHGIPQALLINGHNPLTLLHGALSDGLHAKTDEECLEYATSIRIILTELVERVANAVKDSTELKTAVSRILQKRNPLPPTESGQANPEKDPK